MAPTPLLRHMRTLVLGPWSRRSRLIGASAALWALLSFPAAVPCGAADEQPDGAALYQKHCVSCHPGKLQAASYEDLERGVRSPPIGMPAFGEDKLSDREMAAIGEHLALTSGAERRSAGSGTETSGSSGKSAETVPADRGPEPADDDRPRKRTLKERKAWLKGFGTH